MSQLRVLNNEITLTTADLAVGLNANNNGVLTAANYSWVITALLPNGRESLLTAPAIVAVPSPSFATLQWVPLAGATGYNVYRTVANGAVFLLNGNVKQSAGTAISYDDTVADGKLGNQIPNMQNDGIVLGSPTLQSSMYGTQVVGNRIGAITGTGIGSTNATLLLATLIAQNQLANIGGGGIILNSSTMDCDILDNSLLAVAQITAGEKQIAGIQLRAAINFNVQGNRILQLGPAVDTGPSRRAIYLQVGIEGRVAANQAVDIGPTSTPSMGIYAAVLGRLDILDNDIRRGGTPPAKPDDTAWLALQAFADVATIQGNLFESFGGRPTNPGTVLVAALQTCTFSNNQCFLDDPNGSGVDLVVAIESLSIIAMGNRVKGPVDLGTTNIRPPSMTLIVPSSDTPPVTVIGNITSMGITVQPSGMPAAMVPLNVRA